jgi:hypothetical protein
MSDTGESQTFTFTFDLAADEMRRRAEVIKALGPEWDPITLLRDENAAYDLLYSDLDAEQQAFHDDLVKAGVLPRREAGFDAA